MKSLNRGAVYCLTAQNVNIALQYSRGQFYDSFQPQNITISQNIDKNAEKQAMYR